jgi:hypothetical protein
VAMSRRSTAAGGERDENQEAEDQERESTGPDRPTGRLLALPLHSWRKAYGSGQAPAEKL